MNGWEARGLGPAEQIRLPVQHPLHVIQSSGLRAELTHLQITFGSSAFHYSQTGGFPALLEASPNAYTM